jgi:hypothetical protein
MRVEKGVLSVRSPARVVSLGYPKIYTHLTVLKPNQPFFCP